MSNLYGSFQNNRSTATLCGHSFLTSHIRGWNTGIFVEAIHDGNEDNFKIWATGGSNQPAKRIFIGKFSKNLFQPADK